MVQYLTSKLYLQIMGLSKRTRNIIIKEAFRASQDSFSVHPKLISRLKENFITTDYDEFFTDFVFFLKFPISGITERSTFIDRTLGSRTIILI